MLYFYKTEMNFQNYEPFGTCNNKREKYLILPILSCTYIPRGKKLISPIIVQVINLSVQLIAKEGCGMCESGGFEEELEELPPLFT